MDWISIKSKLLRIWKRLKPNWGKLIINLFIGLGLISMVIGIVIFVVFLYKLSATYTIHGDHIAIPETGEVGDFIGGTVGAIWSLTGALLFYATLRLQSKELIESRKQFEISRITDIVYKQLEFFNSQAQFFELKDISTDQPIIKGIETLSLIRKRVEAIMELPKEDRENGSTAEQDYFRNTLAFIIVNIKELARLYEVLQNHTQIIKTVLIKEDIPPVELNELKNLFFSNIGMDFLHTSENLLILLNPYIEYKENAGEKLDRLYTPEHKLIDAIEGIQNFRLKNYTKETIKQDLKSREFINTTHF